MSHKDFSSADMRQARETTTVFFWSQLLIKTNYFQWCRVGDDSHEERLTMLTQVIVQ